MDRIEDFLSSLHQTPATENVVDAALGAGAAAVAVGAVAFALDSKGKQYRRKATDALIRIAKQHITPARGIEIVTGKTIGFVNGKDEFGPFIYCKVSKSQDPKDFKDGKITNRWMEYVRNTFNAIRADYSETEYAVKFPIKMQYTDDDGKLSRFADFIFYITNPKAHSGKSTLDTGDYVSPTYHN